MKWLFPFLCLILVVTTEPGFATGEIRDTIPESRDAARIDRNATTNVRDTSDVEKNEFVVGLALSGGGAAGLAHIGVLKVFEEAGIPVDVVTGTSMGAIVGALYAIGYSPAMMEEVVIATNWRELFDEQVDRIYLPMDEKQYDGRFLVTFPVKGRTIELPTGLVSGNLISSLFARLTWPYHETEDFRTLPRPFLCIATDLETGEQVVLDQGYLPEAIRASMSIPSIFDPVWYDGKYLIDGGVINNLPVEEAYGIGADYVIAINSSSDLKPADELLTLPDILTQTIAIGMRSSMLVQREKADFYIQPDLRDYSTLSFGDIKEIIQAGEDVARKRLDEITALADSLNGLRRSDEIPEIPEFEQQSTLQIRTVAFRGLETVPRDHILSKLQIENFSTISVTQLNEGLLRLYGMQRFKNVSYRLEWHEERADLIIYFEEQTANSIQAGIHHNSTLGPSLLFNATFRNLFFPASTARINMRAGYEAMFEGQYFNYIGLEPRLAFHGAAGFREREIDIFDNGRRQSNLRTDMLYGEGLIGPLYASVIRAGFGYRYERFNLTESYGELNVPVDWNNLHLFVGEIEFDNLNFTHSPTKGQYWIVRAELAPQFLPNDAAFGKISGTQMGYYSLSSNLVLIQRLHGGHIFGGNPPLHYRMYAGAHDAFWGYRKDALAGNNLLTARLALQYMFYRNFYVTPGFNIGDSYNRLDLNVFDSFPRWGWGAVAGWNTVLGPLEAVFSGSSDNPLLFEFQLGINF